MDKPTTSTGRVNSSTISGIKFAGALGGLLPPLFLEAQVSGNQQLITQLGFSLPASEHLDVAILTFMKMCSLLAALSQLGARILNRLTALFNTKLCIAYGTISLKIRARTSGTAFAIGIGSFMAYKLFWRLLRSNCLWTTLDQLSPESEEATFSRAEKPVELSEGFYAIRLGGENELLRSLDKCLSGQSSPVGSQGKAVVAQVPHTNVLKQLSRRSQRIKEVGIGCSTGEQSSSASGPQNILFRHDVERRRKRWSRDEDEQSLSGLSDLTSASRIEPNPRPSESGPSLADALPWEFHDQSETPPAQQCFLRSSRSNSSSVGTRQSASLQCDNELYWDNEFSASTCTDVDFDGDDIDEAGSSLFLFRERDGSLGGLSQLSAMQNLEKMFNRNWQEHDQGEGSDENLMENALENLREMDRLQTNASTSSMLDLIGTKERHTRTGDEAHEQFPFTAYRIVVQNEVEPSICGSSGRYERHKNSPVRQAKGISRGLWELTSATSMRGANSLSMEKSRQSEEQQLQTPTTSGQGLLSPTVMVDSVISSHSSLLSTAAPCRPRVVNDPNVMFDSAMYSGDEDGKEDQPEMNEEEKARNNSGIFSRRYDVLLERPLSKISEQSTPVRHNSRTANDSSSRRPSSPEQRPPSVQGSEPSLEWFY